MALGMTVLRRPLVAPVVILAVVAAGSAYVGAVDPNESGHYPLCPFLAITGYYCPGCGSLRMVHALAHGHAAEAFGRNPLAFVLLPLLAFAWGRWALSSYRGQPFKPLLRPWAIIALAVLIVVYAVVRNLPFGQALAP